MIAWMLVAALVQPEVGCTTCHPAERVQFEKSVHSREGVGCDSCHGGDPEALEVEKAHGGDYKGVPARSEIPRHCAACHSDPAQMRPYNLPTDQYALYQISSHGRMLAKGESPVAVCSDCHGAHDVLSSQNPDSPTYARNVPETCGKCHADEALMKRYQLPDTTLEEFRDSVHGRALLDRGNLNAPNCARCHGVHGATPPGIGDVDKVCGQCHASAREFYDESAHRRGLTDAGYLECASCHGSHQIGPAGTELASQVCHECHEDDSQAVEIGRRLMTLQDATSSEVERAGELIVDAEQVPIDVEDYRARLELAKTHLSEIYPAMHSLEVEKVSTFALTARSEAEDIQREIYDKLSDIRVRRLGLVVFWFYILLTVAILVRLHHQKVRF